VADSPGIAGRLPDACKGAVAISTIALVVLVVLLIILECAVFRKKPDKPQTLMAYQY
jgi:hypothetical protein